MASPRRAADAADPVPSRGRFVGSGNGPSFQPIDIGHADYVAVLEPDTAFWALVPKEDLAEVTFGDRLAKMYSRQAATMAQEMNHLRDGLTPSAVYFNPTERCNLDCTYCYIPKRMRRRGQHMPAAKILEALEILKQYFRGVMPKGTLPQIVFHGAEPLLHREAVFAGIEQFQDDFQFGVQTNATLLDDETIAFLRAHDVSLGISLDAATSAIADRTRTTWRGEGVYKQVLAAMARLKGYPAWSVICTISTENVRHLSQLVEFLHRQEVPNCLLNVLRCTLPGARPIRPDDAVAAKYFLKAIDRTRELYLETGRKMVVGNFANILLAIVAPTARRLMCDISPCGGGRCFFALAPSGDLFPCSEFIGLPDFCGGNLFRDEIPTVLQSEPFRRVTGRRVEDIEPCRRCAIRHFCGAPCPAEAYEMRGGKNCVGAFCEFYEEQVRYAFRAIADEKVNDFLWDQWDHELATVF